MEKAIVIIVGLAAAGYIARLIWRAAGGQGTCHCGSACGADCGSDKKSGCGK